MATGGAGMLDARSPATVESSAKPREWRDRNIAVLIDPSRARRFHHEMIARFVGKGARVSVLFGRSTTPLPPSIDLLLSLERLVYRLRGSLLSDRVPYEGGQLQRSPAAGRFDVVLDLCGDDSAPTAHCTLRPLYDGVCGEAALVAALLAGRMPVVEIEDVQRRVVVARG